MRQGETGQGEFSILVLVVGAVLCIGAGVLIVSFLGDSRPEEVTGQLGSPRCPWRSSALARPPACSSLSGGRDWLRLVC